MSSDLRNAKKRLEALRSLCVIESEADRQARLQRQEAEEQRLAKMSPLERFVYTTTKEVNELQQKQIEYNDKMGSDPAYMTSRDAVKMRNDMNKMKMALRTRSEKMPPPKTEEEKRTRESLKRVLDKIKKADRQTIGSYGSISTPGRNSTNLYSDLDAPLHRSSGVNDDDKPAGAQEWDGEEMPGGNYEPITLDQEFQGLMEKFRENDQEIDRLLENIQHGVVALHQTAKNISIELKTQDVLITEAEKKMDNVHSQLVGVNKKLKKTIKEVNKDKLCLYVICCLLLLALVGVILVVTKTVN
jgi:hypothetical protein